MGSLVVEVPEAFKELAEALEALVVSVQQAHVVEKLAPSARVLYGAQSRADLERWLIGLHNRSSAAARNPC